MTYEKWLEKNDYTESLIMQPCVAITRKDCMPIWKDEKGHKFIGLSPKRLWELCQKESDKRLKRHCATIHSLVDEVERRQKVEKELKEELCKQIKTISTAAKRISELEAQIEKMRCCGNCKGRHTQKQCSDCHNYSKWELEEAEQFYQEIVD